MPGVNRDPNERLAQIVAQLLREVSALKAQVTKYVTNPSTSQTTAIIGDISHDAAGNPTGLSGWGIATFNGSAWTQL